MAGKVGKRAYRGPELVQRGRAALLKAMELVDQGRGKPIAELLADEIVKNPIKFMDLLSKYCPKEVDINTTDLTLERLLDAVETDEVPIFAKELRQYIAASNSTGLGEAGIKAETPNKLN